MCTRKFTLHGARVPEFILFTDILQRLFTSVSSSTYLQAKLQKQLLCLVSRHNSLCRLGQRGGRGERREHALKCRLQPLALIPFALARSIPSLHTTFVEPNQSTSRPR